MAKITSLFSISGSIGNHTFVQSKNGCYVRERKSNNKKKFATDPRFKHLRDNNAEFERAVKAGKLLRNAVQELMCYAKDTRVSSRLTSLLAKIIKNDLVNPRGERKILPGNTGCLENFNFNEQARLHNIFLAPFTTRINREEAVLEINVPGFNPEYRIKAPQVSTHCKIVSAAAEIDFDNGTFESISTESALLPLNSNAIPMTTLTNRLPKAGEQPLFLFAGILFYEETNGTKHLIKSSSANPFSIVKVSSN